MQNIKQKILAKKDLNKFLDNLMRDYEIIAPVKSNPTKFKIIKSPNEIYLDKITLIPFKEYFMPNNEILLKINKNKIKENKTKIKKRIIFGARKCDLNSLKILDKVMCDCLYLNKRKNTILIGIFCENPDKYCFCNSMELEDFYDLFFYPHKNNYYISIGSKTGKKLVSTLKNADKKIIKNPKNTKQIKNKNIEKDYNNKLWKKDSNKCLSCSACTVYCPTCNCFDIKDNLKINLIDAKRTRSWASCQLKSFSEVAGGKIFRESRLSRFKHFVYHKIVYYKKRFNRYMCVGCGRCLRVCPTHIDWTNTINKIKNDIPNKKI